MKKELITSKKGFTLIELIAILVILSIAILIVLPALQKTNEKDTYLQMNKERFEDEFIDEETLEYEYAYFTDEEVQDYITVTPETIEDLTNRLEAFEQNTSDTIETLTNRLESIEQSTSLIVLLNKIYPIGSVYISSSSTNPGSYLTGTTWVAYGQGRTIIGVGSNGTTTYSAGGTGGSETHNHGGKAGNTTLTVAQIPSHNHGMYSGYGDGSAGIDAYRFQQWASNNLSWKDYSIYGTASTGGGGSHNHTISSNSNVQPYIVTYIWRRTA